MRTDKRINNFLDKIDIKNYLNTIVGLDKKLTKNVAIDINDNSKLIKDTWTLNPDLRFCQVLISLDMLPNKPGFWFYIEEEEVLIKQGIEPRECVYWGQYYDKNNKPIPDGPKWYLIKDLNTEHIEAIVKGGFVDADHTMFEIFVNELQLRKKS